jgi:hypothetical protein
MTGKINKNSKTKTKKKATDNLNKPITITKSTFKKYEASHFFPMI